MRKFQNYFFFAITLKKTKINFYAEKKNQNKVKYKISGLRSSAIVMNLDYRIDRLFRDRIHSRLKIEKNVQ